MNCSLTSAAGGVFQCLCVCIITCEFVVYVDVFNAQHICAVNATHFNECCIARCSPEQNHTQFIVIVAAASRQYQTTLYVRILSSCVVI